MTFTPRDTPRGLRRRRVRLTALLVAVLLVLGVGGWLGSRWLDARGARCHGLDSTEGEGYALSLAGDQCIGWIVEEDHAFGSTDERVNAVITAVVKENQRVHDQAGRTGGTPYVRIAVLMPMTSREGSAMRDNEVLHALQGAYAAQRQANQGRSVLGDPTPQVQLVLANEGRDQEHWAPVVRQLGALRGGDHPLVAVTGMGISIDATKQAADELGRLQIPAVGAVLTADDMTSPLLFKTTPSNAQYTLALKAFLDGSPKRTEPAKRTGYLLFDRNQDKYVQSLRAAFTTTFGEEYGLKGRSGGFNGSASPNGTPLLLSELVQDVCAAKPDVLFFAGRGRDIDDLMQALALRTGCREPDDPLIVATGATGISIEPQALDEANAILLNAAATDTRAWLAGEPGTPKHFGEFRTWFAGLGFAEDDLRDGYAIMHHDAVAATVWAARRAARSIEAVEGQRLKNEDVGQHLYSSTTDLVPGASGEIYFAENPPNDRWPIGKPIPVLKSGPRSDTLTTGPVYLTQPKA
ncbi:hypothetical protein GCM10022243_19870 [Saccharothrix violaceirubra]|uniref:ABC-type branched-subunit amino acid transport system substrate-binding protein n=1 Tax=Saccharothrix violaceirubra TaxID=413306 RepID=A0A7W7T1Z9_9PSEU|nr:ABC transporter substrate-binding protein [Saccharothrix violaceirubra]MBB4965108.1 ABC-type branched-subunit amino acid transport system substrate-binding protein [Saccharothrix violaceirubra]